MTDVVIAEYPDEQAGLRKTLPPLPMIRKSTHSPMTEALQGAMPSQGELERLEARGRERHQTMAPTTFVQIPPVQVKYLELPKYLS